MSILTIILVILLFGVGLWAINRFIPMDAKVKNILNVVAIIALVLWLLKAFGVFETLSRATI